jgi:hypothetical protein
MDNQNGQVQPQPQVPPAMVAQAIQGGAVPPIQPQLQQQQAGGVQPPYARGIGGVQKEQLVAPAAPEKVPLVELYEQEKIPEEVEGWMEKLEQAGEIKIPEAIKKDEQVILDNAVPTSVRDTVVLPLSQKGAAVAAKQKVTESARWLYEWCKRLVKILGERAKYREAEEI